LQTTLHRCPRNSDEQFGQIEEASFFRLAGTRLALPAGVSTALGAAVELEELGVGFGSELMSGVVAQIHLQENITDGEPAKRVATKLGPILVPSGQTHARGSSVKASGAVPKW
jgi:hypothetical protein